MITEKQSNFIKIVGIIAMISDHLGAFLYPSIIELRIIGRMALPLFTYQLAVGSLMTTNKKNYIKRLLCFAFISQVPYYFLMEKLILNIIFSLALGVIAIWVIENKKYYIFLLIIPISFFVDYHIYGLLMILIFYFFRSTKIQFILFLLITILYSYFFYPWQLFSVLSLIFIFKPFLEINLPKNFFYIFYPAHLFVILLIKIIF